jgi:hypothetical protein
MVPGMYEDHKSYKASLVVLSFSDGFTDTERDERIDRLLALSDDIWKDIGEWVDILSDEPASMRIRDAYANIEIIRALNDSDIKPDIE